MRSILSAIIVLSFFSCTKENMPSMHYRNYDLDISYGHSNRIDLNEDGAYDLMFNVYLIGDPIAEQDKLRFAATSFVNGFVLIDEEGKSPIMSKGEVITAKNMIPYVWYEVNQVYLSQKIMSKTDTWWEGPWKDVNHKYFALQVKKEGRLYNAWVELSFDTANEKLIVHRSGISLQPDVSVNAGE